MNKELLEESLACFPKEASKVFSEALRDYYSRNPNSYNWRGSLNRLEALRDLVSDVLPEGVSLADFFSSRSKLFSLLAFETEGMTCYWISKDTVNPSTVLGAELKSLCSIKHCDGESCRGRTWNHVPLAGVLMRYIRMEGMVLDVETEEEVLDLVRESDEVYNSDPTDYLYAKDGEKLEAYLSEFEILTGCATTVIDIAYKQYSPVTTDVLTAYKRSPRAIRILSGPMPYPEGYHASYLGNGVVMYTRNHLGIDYFFAAGDPQDTLSFFSDRMCHVYGRHAYRVYKSPEGGDHPRHDSVRHNPVSLCVDAIDHVFSFLPNEGVFIMRYLSRRFKNKSDKLIERNRWYHPLFEDDWEHEEYLKWLEGEEYSGDDDAPSLAFQGHGGDDGGGHVEGVGGVFFPGGVYIPNPGVD